MRKIDWRGLLAQALIVCGIMLFALSNFGKHNSSPIVLDETYAIVRPTYQDLINEPGRISVNLGSVTTVASLKDTSSQNGVFFFIALIVVVVFVNNLIIELKMIKQIPKSNALDDDEASFKRLHAYLSHEQKNNLAIIRARMELAHDSETIAYIDRISHSMDDVLTLSDTGVAEELECVDMTLLIAEVCDDYKLLADIDYTFDTSENTILSKYQWVFRAMSNLLDNAVKFGDKKPISVNLETRNNTVVVSIKDRGIGIASDEIDKIFNYEYRVNSLKSDGYGIGLSLVNRVVDLSGGVVWVESVVKEGTTFYLCFPELTRD